MHWFALMVIIQPGVIVGCYLYKNKKKTDSLHFPAVIFALTSGSNFGESSSKVSRQLTITLTSDIIDGN